MPGDRPLRLATRGSAQARTQARGVAEALMRSDPDLVVELVFVETLGDRTQHDEVPLHTIGGQGVFVKEIQNAVLRGDADMAVHSAKDLPSEAAEGLRLAAFCARRDARDVLVGATLADLAAGATVATGSVRRRAQLTVARPDLQFVELRGNIHTRLGKVPPGGAIVMAAAALEVLDMLGEIAEYLPPASFVPSPGQGCVAVECRADDDAMISVLSTVDHQQTREAVEIERAFLAELGSGCSLPVGAYVCDGSLIAFLASADLGRHVIESIGLAGDHGVAVASSAALARSMHERVL
ncbi:MAG: hydroxymethylbilane synthase [Ilumatobacteraceae bacterium]